jgi:hypothetical protein
MLAQSWAAPERRNSVQNAANWQRSPGAEELCVDAAIAQGGRNGVPHDVPRQLVLVR